MGVTILHPYPVPENKTGAQTIEVLTKRLLALGATQSNGKRSLGFEECHSNSIVLVLSFTVPSARENIVSCETYLSVPELGPTRTVHVLHNSEFPASVFSILDNGSKQTPIVADGLFDLLMLKLAPFYTSKKQTRIESKGPRFELGDFLIKLGSVTMNQNFKGVLVEIEYRPCVIPASCWELIRECLQGYLNMTVSKSLPSYFQIHERMYDTYKPIDSIQQYLEHFTTYRKQTTASAGMMPKMQP